MVIQVFNIGYHPVRKRKRDSRRRRRRRRRSDGVRWLNIVCFLLHLFLHRAQAVRSLGIVGIVVFVLPREAVLMIRRKGPLLMLVLSMLWQLLQLRLVLLRLQRVARGLLGGERGERGAERQGG
jgi:hypothetical protein